MSDGEMRYAAYMQSRKSITDARSSALFRRCATGWERYLPPMKTGGVEIHFAPVPAVPEGLGGAVVWNDRKEA